MHKWLALLGAITTEVAGSLSMRAAVDQPCMYVLVLPMYCAAFLCLARALHAGLALGVAYGIWSAAGVALTAVFASALFGEQLTPIMAIGITLVVAGVLLVEVGSRPARKQVAQA
ncbi:DMT family transporter [Cellulosimicrobium cellulans]|uniref:DMT family transporter n=1 Tax=Cellulosimicrobium cellulans TaxID=1710 RepID=UPI0016527290|nr:SMR family transporter [Cellulosimicrobium cellulans]